MTKTPLSAQKIIETSIALIEAQQPLTFTNIAKALDTKSQALYPYFANQNVLSYAIMGATLQMLIDRIKTDLFGMGGRKALIQFALICRAQCLAHPHLSQFVLALPQNEEAPAAQAAKADYQSLMTSLINHTLQHDRLRLLATQLINTLISGEVINAAFGWSQQSAAAQTGNFRWMITTGLDQLMALDAV